MCCGAGVCLRCLGSYLVGNGIPGNLIGTTALGKVRSRGTLAALGANGYLTSTFGSPAGQFFFGRIFRKPLRRYV
jgi:hypothetical protein